jgi:hypothetical protein
MCGPLAPSSARKTQSNLQRIFWRGGRELAGLCGRGSPISSKYRRANLMRWRRVRAWLIGAQRRRRESVTQSVRSRVTLATYS